MGWGIGESVFFLFPAGADPRGDILEYAEGADYRAVYPAEEESNDDQCDNDTEVQGEDGGQELYFGEPSEPCVERTGEVEEQQSDQREADYCQGQSDFT